MWSDMGPGKYLDIQQYIGAKIMAYVHIAAIPELWSLFSRVKLT